MNVITARNCTADQAAGEADRRSNCEGVSASD